MDRLYPSESDVNRRQILVDKDDPGTKRVKVNNYLEIKVFRDQSISTQQGLKGLEHYLILVIIVTNETFTSSSAIIEFKLLNLPGPQQSLNSNF